MPIDRESADILRIRMERAKEWPLRSEEKVLTDLLLWQAFRENDADYIKPNEWKDERPYYTDPLALRIAEAKADLTFGAEPDFTAANTADQGRLEDLVEANDLPSELQAGDEIRVSEGEVWWRVLVDRDALDWPLIEFHSRINVFPYFRGRNLLAAAFISIIEEPAEVQDKRAWRYVELHSEGLVQNLLYEVQHRGDQSRREGTVIPQVLVPASNFGQRVSLQDRPETADLDDEWEHDLPSMLCGRIINRKGRNPKLGQSVYARVKDLLLSLNEATTVGHENMKLTAKKRAVVSSSVLRPTQDAAGNPVEGSAPVFDGDDDVLVSTRLEDTLGESGQEPFKVLEYSFDAEALIAWIDNRVDTILTRCRTAPQLVGRHTEDAATGPAFRARLVDSILDNNGRARYWDDSLPRILSAAAQVDAMPEASGGFGRGWSAAAEPPAIERSDALPEDEDERANRLAVERGAGLKSRKTAVAEMHPDWEDDAVDEEVQAIADEESAPLIQLPTRNPSEQLSGAPQDIPPGETS